MPIHDWTKVPAGLFHHFHQDWAVEIARRLNQALLPKDLSALVEQRVSPFEADVLTVEDQRKSPRSRSGNGKSTQTLERPITKIVRKTNAEVYGDRANRIVVKHHLGRTVAVIEIMSPGNKHSKLAMREFVEKTLDYLTSGIHVLIVDLFPPTPRDPFGIHKLIWDEFEEEEFVFPKGKDRILVSYEMGSLERSAFVEPVAVGDTLPDMALFLAPGLHVYVPLESTYLAAWNASPEALREAVTTGILPTTDEDD
jgi:hypothetical protein